MRDITTNNDGSQDKNQKATPATKSLSEFILLNDIPTDEISHIWLGRRDSNPRMLGPEPSALPLGDSPISIAERIFIRALFLLERHANSDDYNREAPTSSTGL